MADLIVRPERPVDVTQIRAVVTAAFDSRDEADLVERIRDSAGYVPGLSLVATLDLRVVGHIMISEVALVDEATRHAAHCLAPLAVDPRHQGCGIGARLVREALARADEMGLPLVVLEGRPNYYSRFGFEHAAAHGIHIGLPGWAPVTAAQVIRLRAYRPEIRGSVEYPPAFDVVVGAHDVAEPPPK